MEFWQLCANMLTYKYYFLCKILPFIKMHYGFSRGLELIDLPGYFKEIELITLRKPCHLFFSVYYMETGICIQYIYLENCSSPSKPLFFFQLFDLQVVENNTWEACLSVFSNKPIITLLSP